MAARLILGTNIRESARQALMDLHWLPINARIDFKICVMVFKCLSKNAPNYLIKVLKPKLNNRPGLRSNENGKLLDIPYTRCKIFADRSFSVYGPKLWNSLPSDIRNCTSLSNFRKQLKTFLFTREFL